MNEGHLTVTGGASVDGEVVVTPDPLAELDAARRQAEALALAGASVEIRYAAGRASEMLRRLLDRLERHRRLVGAPR
jgi:hypothetical protein